MNRNRNSRPIFDATARRLVCAVGRALAYLAYAALVVTVIYLFVQAW